MPFKSEHNVHIHIHVHSLSSNFFTLFSCILFLESFTKLDSDQRAHSSNYTGGEKTGQSWTDKVLGHKSTDEHNQATGGGGGEVDDDEWVRIYMYMYLTCICIL